MNIVYTLNDKFVPQVAASMCSVCENNTDFKQITFFLFQWVSIVKIKNA